MLFWGRARAPSPMARWAWHSWLSSRASRNVPTSRWQPSSSPRTQASRTLLLASQRDPSRRRRGGRLEERRHEVRAREDLHRVRRVRVEDQLEVVPDREGQRGAEVERHVQAPAAVRRRDDHDRHADVLVERAVPMGQDEGAHPLEHGGRARVRSPTVQGPSRRACPSPTPRPCRRRTGCTSRAPRRRHR